MKCESALLLIVSETPDLNKFQHFDERTSLTGLVQATS
jgi:hypothetical protein